MEKLRRGGRPIAQWSRLEAGRLMTSETRGDEGVRRPARA